VDPLSPTDLVAPLRHLLDIEPGQSQPDRPPGRARGVMVFSTQKSKFYTKNIENKKARFSTQSYIIYFKKK
jgi:hypothetical protein